MRTALVSLLSRAVLGLVAWAALPSPIFAQWPVRPGDIVRVWVPSYGLKAVTAKVEDTANASLGVRSRKIDTTLVIPRTALRRLELYQGESRGTGGGVLVGTLA